MLALVLLTGCAFSVRSLDEQGRPERGRVRREDGSLPAAQRFAWTRAVRCVEANGMIIVLPDLEPVRPAGGVEPGEGAIGVGLDLLALPRAFDVDELPGPALEPPAERDVERALRRVVEDDIERALDAARALEQRPPPERVGP